MSKHPNPSGILQRIQQLRGLRVLLDTDLAEIYGVDTKTLKRAVRRNISRFPDDFMFQVTAEELNNLRYQIGTSSSTPQSAHGGTRHLSFAFTQEGIAMLSGVLKSKPAIEVNITIMRAFVAFRELLETNESLLRKVKQLEKNYLHHDDQLKRVFDAIRKLITNNSPRIQKRIKGLDSDER